MPNTGDRCTSFLDQQIKAHFYRRWDAYSEEHGLEKTFLAALKLTNGVHFQPNKKDHVFSVLSQRICLDAVLVGSEANTLTDRSVSSHMRLLTGFSDDYRLFHTYAPSEPILTLGALEILYNESGLPKNLLAL